MSNGAGMRKEAIRLVENKCDCKGSLGTNDQMSSITSNSITIQNKLLTLKNT